MTTPRTSSSAGLPLLILLVLSHFGCGGGSGAAPTPSGPTPLEPSAYLLVETGTLPLVLSAPHGGTLDAPGVPVRTQGTTVLDTNTLELIQAVQQRLQTLTGGKAHVVAARVSRKYVDFNRTSSEAYESPAMAAIYQGYHTALRTAVDTERGSTKALLVDLHGQGQDPAVVFRGTRDGLTANLPLLCGPGGFLDRLWTGGVVLNPRLAAGLESPDFNGGYIVATYGRNAPNGLNAVQLEFGFSYRDGSAQINATADKVATALAGGL